MPKVRLELATPGLQTQCLSHRAIQLKSYCWEGVEFIQLMYCIIIYLSFLNCDWLLIREVQWFYWTQKLLVPVVKFTVRMPKVRLELATPGLQTQCFSHWAIQLKSYCWEGVEFIQLVYCIIIYLSFLNCDWLLIREVQWLEHWVCNPGVASSSLTFGNLMLVLRNMVLVLWIHSLVFNNLIMALQNHFLVLKNHSKVLYNQIKVL